MKPVIFGLAGETLSADERAFFAEAEPAGYILFKRNIVDRAQLRALGVGERGGHEQHRLVVQGERLVEVAGGDGLVRRGLAYHLFGDGRRG